MRRFYLVVLPFLSILIASCSQGVRPAFSEEQRKTVESAVRAVKDLDSLAVLQQNFEKGDNVLGSIIAYRELGRRLRNESRFSEAIDAHTKGLDLAESARDTIEWVQALNNIGTDFRRMGVLARAHDYHLKACKIVEEFSDTSSTTAKSRLVALNGLGNIYLSIGNYNRADSVFRLALAGESRLRSATGQAINYANIGSIFEHNGQLDSAWVYYDKSMEFNKVAGNFLGISLCHTYFGHLYELDGKYALAAEEYQTACDLMKDSKDDWHMLNSLVALAGINLKMGKESKALDNLASAREVAERIDSPDHLEKIEELYYEYYKSRGDYKAALSSFEKSVGYGRGILNSSIVEDINKSSYDFERESLSRQRESLFERLQRQNELRHRERFLFSFLFVFLALLALMLLFVTRYRSKSLKMAGQLSKMRDSFFSNVTHESRTPLTVIIGLSRDLQEDVTVSDDVKKKAKSIERQGNKMLTLINQILDVSKVKSAVGNPKWQNSDIVSYLSMLVSSYQSYADSRGIGLRFINYGPETVTMDFVPDYVAKVINNLLSNAFKYTPEGGRIEVRAAKAGNNMKVEVADSGIGIGKEAMPHIFEPYYQSSSGMRAMGTGIGLTLVKQIVDTVQGDISVESTVGKGSVFHLSIPIHNDCAPARQSSLTAGSPLIPEEDDLMKSDSDSEVADDDEVRILVVDDNRDIAEYIGEELPESYSIYYAADGKEGLDRTLELTPDIVITDWMMPKMNGLDLCKSIRSNEIINHIPVVILTARALEEDRIEGTKAGADAFLSKPFNSEELRAVVENLMEGRRIMREKFKQGAGLRVVKTSNDPEALFLDKVSDAVKDRMERGEKIDVPQIAYDLCISTSQLHRKVKSVSGYSPAEYFQRIKVTAAQEIISSDPDISLSDVSDRCGFNDYSSFLRGFKSVLGQTPSEYREKCIALLLQGDTH